MNKPIPLLVITTLIALIMGGLCLEPLHFPVWAATDGVHLLPGQGSDGDFSTGPRISQDGNSKGLAVRMLSALGFEDEAAESYATWFWGAPLLAILIILAMIFWPWQKRTYSDTPLPTRATPPRKKTKDAAPSALSDKPLPEPSTDKERVLRFFFNLYKQQIGADENAPSQMYVVENRPTCPNETYEMRVMQDSDWSSRRMSIGLLGQGGGSRSKCFYVIFDSHLVLKIPSVPITDFSVYHKQVEAEGRIVARLVPRECIVPRIGVILKAIYTFPRSGHLGEDALEKKYVQLVKSDPSYQKYLKIGASFAFFMDLSKHFFLSTTLDEMHRSDQPLVSEALKNPELLWDQHGFVCRYGEDSGVICQELQEAYYKSEARMRQLVEQVGLNQEVTSFDFKEWYLTHLAGEKVDQDSQDLPHELIERINRHLFTVVKNNHPSVERYRRQVREYIQETRFSQNRLRLENLATNTLSLLDWIGAKGLALRDLKPENLFVAGDPNNYPTFLNDTMRFSIGLIDVETAVVVDTDSPDDIPQPQLAGTPLYATPSHLLPNTILKEVYGDVRKILLMQDWYATIAIIYKSVIGENLFSATARVFPEILTKLKLIDPAGPDLESDVARISQLFWNSAKAEFQEALVGHWNILRRVDVVVPGNLVHDIVKAMHHESGELTHNLSQILDNQQLFVGEEKCQFLADAPAKKIAMMKQKLLGNGRDGGGRSAQRQKAFDLLEQIEHLKIRMERKFEAAATLKATSATIAVDQLLEAMFQKVFSEMHLANWPGLSLSKWQGGASSAEDMTTYQATM